jgi:carbohydrate diacid regulator
MSGVTEQFDRVAAAVARRVGDLVDGPVLVADARGGVIASSEPRYAGLPLVILLGTGELRADCLRVPIQLDGQAGEVVIPQRTDNGPVSRRLIEGLIELVLHQVAFVARLPNQHELKNKFIYDLLHGLAREEADILREAELLGMDFTRPRAVLLIDAADYILNPGRGRPDQREARMRRRAQGVIDSVVSFFHLPSETICAYIGDGEVAVLKASSTQDLQAWAEGDDSAEPASASWANLGALKRAATALLGRLKRDTNAALSIGIGRYHPGIGGLALSYEDARAALSVGRRAHGRDQVHCLDSLGVAAFVGIADEPTKVSLASYLLSPLDGAPDLIETLQAFFAENCSPSFTASRLAIHRNTLGYRLDRIASLTGLDPRRFDDAVQIRLALALRGLRDDGASVQTGADGRYTAAA